MGISLHASMTVYIRSFFCGTYYLLRNRTTSRLTMLAEQGSSGEGLSARKGRINNVSTGVVTNTQQMQAMKSSSPAFVRTKPAAYLSEPHRIAGFMDEVSFFSERRWRRTACTSMVK